MSTDQRSSYRCSAVKSGQQAVLQVGRNQCIVDLQDQSVGGFAVRSRITIDLKPGQIVALRTSTGWSEVEVVHVDLEHDETLIGLRRLRELPDPRLAQALHRSSWPQFLIGRSLQSSGSPLASLLTLALLLMIGFWIVVSHSVWLPKLQRLWKQSPTSSTSRETIPSSAF